MTDCEFCKGKGTQTRKIASTPNKPGPLVDQTVPCPTCRFEAFCAYWNRNESPAHWQEWDRLNNDLEGK